MELVLKIGVSFSAKKILFFPLKNEPADFQLPPHLRLPTTNARANEVLIFSFTGMFNGVRDIVHRIPEGDGLIDERQMALGFGVISFVVEKCPRGG